MPSARMQADGALSVATSQSDTEDLYYVTYQAFPWLEASFRYLIPNPGKKFGAGDVRATDRSFEAKIRLVEESGVLPQVALGARDLLGTGRFSGEYLVASKQWDRLDLTVGLGWGRLSGRDVFSNPFGGVRNRNDALGGQPLLDTYFRGDDLGLFGGMRYQLPKNFEFIAEYSSDSRAREIRKNIISDALPWSAGLAWQPTRDVSVTVSRQLGQDWALTVAAQLDTRAETPRKPRQAFWSVNESPARSGRAEELDTSLWYARLLFDVERQGLLLLSGHLTDGNRVVWLEVENLKFAYSADAIERVLTLSEVHLPPEVHTVNVTLQNDGVAQGTVRYRRRVGVADQAAFGQVFEEDLLTVMPVSPAVADPAFRTGFVRPLLNVSGSIGQRVNLMDPDDPLRFQILGRLNLDLDIGGDWYVRSSLMANIYNDFEDIRRPSSSVLPRVRSNIDKYLKQGDTGIDSLYLEKRGMISPEVSYRAYGGILETMFSGVGAEVLWEPFPSRLAFGANLNYARQRDFDARFDHLDYDVITGHASVYWASPFDGYDAAVHAGRYLAKDYGATFEVRRTFDSGWQVGGFFTLTEVPFETFGEGSFDKGIFFRVPLNAFFKNDTQGVYSTSIRTIQRDGGARLDGFGDALYWEGRGARPDALARTRARMVPQ